MIRRRRRLKPWQVERMVRDFLAERDRRTAALQPTTRFRVGDRVRVGQTYTTITGVLATKRHTRYRLQDRQYLYFESDLTAADDE